MTINSEQLQLMKLKPKKLFYHKYITFCRLFHQSKIKAKIRKQIPKEQSYKAIKRRHKKISGDKFF